MPFEYCEFSGAACAKDEKQVEPLAHATGGQKADHEQQLADALEEKTIISDAKRGSGKKAGSKPVRVGFFFLSSHKYSRPSASRLICNEDLMCCDCGRRKLRISCGCFCFQYTYMFVLPVQLYRNKQMSFLLLCVLR